MVMAHYQYTAEKHSGETYRGVMDAPDRFTVYESIRKEGAHVLTLKETRVDERLTLEYWNAKIGSVPEHAKVVLARNLGSMLSAGLPLGRALDISERQAESVKLRSVISQVSESVRHGSPLHKALALHPSVFSKLLVAMVRAGEESGNLAQSLAVVGEQMERSYNLKKSIRGALVYPCVVLVAIFGVGYLMMTQVVPQLASTFKEMGSQLPASTRAMIFVSDMLTKNTLTVFLGIAGVVAAFVFVSRTRQGKRVFDFALLHMPLIGQIVQETNAARAARTMASLATSGVDMISTINITRDVVQNGYFKDVLDTALVSIEKGENLSKAFGSKSSVYPPLFGEMIAVGEETGQLGVMLGRLADFYETEVMRKSKDMSTVIEPFLMIGIGSAVGFFAMAMISPVYQLTDQLGYVLNAFFA